MIDTTINNSTVRLVTRENGIQRDQEQAGLKPRRGTTMVVDTFEPVTLAELNDHAALLTRRDRKYAVNAATAEEFIAALPVGTRALDIDGNRSFPYASLYADTPQRHSFLLASHGRRRRFKIRTRSHGYHAPVFMEIKTPGPRGLIVKDQVGALPNEAVDDRSDLPKLWGLLAESGLLSVALSALDFRGVTSPAVGTLRPCLEITYNRSTLLMPDEHARVTVDTDLTFRAVTPRSHGEGWDSDEEAWRGEVEVSDPITLDDFAIIETKTDGAATSVDFHLWRKGKRPDRVSKFGIGMALTNPDLPAHRWGRVLRAIESGTL
ncbi:MAG: VTC domain-containing protein [Propionibacteriaceae bacterium]|jgi:hypothetical protein|nr:VTC domain-containing protein [Propionibacteriaceae bacterium]